MVNFATEAAFSRPHSEGFLVRLMQDKWGLSWQITPRVLTNPIQQGGEVAKRAFEAMITVQKIDVAGIEAATAG